MNKSTRDYTEMADALALVGFAMWPDHPGFFQHTLLGDRIFDFTACSIEGAIATLYLTGEKNGTYKTAKKMGKLIKELKE